MTVVILSINFDSPISLRHHRYVLKSNVCCSHFGFQNLIMAEGYLALDLFMLERRCRQLSQRKIARQRRERQNPLNLANEEFLRLYRVTKDIFAELVDALKSSLQRKRPYGLSVESQILTALRFYACGSYQLPVGLQWGCSMSQKSVSRVVRQVTLAINTHLLRKYIKFPKTAQEIHKAKQIFQSSSHSFPGAVGAIDCTHIKILAPKVHEEAYVSGHHEGHSLNVQAVCDPNLFILNINARWPGARHDAYIWANSPVRTAMKKNFDDGDHSTWLLGDDGYPLEPWLMTPIKNSIPGSSEHKYTYAHCAARNVIERCFGVLKSVFRCLSRQRQLMYDPCMSGLIVNACAVLHNMRLKNNLTEQLTGEILNINDSEENMDMGQNSRAVADRIRKRLVLRHFT